jgi:preprotein translocase subunit SecD
MKSLKLRIAIVLLVLIGCIYTIFTKSITLGLDLQGGTHLVLQVDVGKALENEVSTVLREIKNILQKENIPFIEVQRKGKEAEITLLDKNDVVKVRSLIEEYYGRMFNLKANGEKIALSLKPSFISGEVDRLCEQALETIRNRVDQLGVAEPVIVRNGKDRIIVELPGIKDPDRAKKVIGKVARLEFKEVVDVSDSLVELITKFGGIVPAKSISKLSPETLKEIVKESRAKIPDDEEVLLQEIKDKSGKVVGYRFFVVKREPILTGAYLKDAYPSMDEYGMPAVSFELNSEGARIFKEYTSKHVGTRLAIVLDDKVQSAPTIRSSIGARGQITGQFSYQEAKDLSIVLRAGALPAPVKIIEETTVGPSLGKESIEKGLKAGIAGLILVMLFMIVYYKLSGVIANLALLMNVAVLWSMLCLLGATLTLPGIAGFILTIGMAVDANVIIFERIREELRKGRNIFSSVEAGFSRAWGTIVDANITTLIAATVLFQFGTGPIKGFAVTLSLGILSSMFTAVFVTKVLLDIVVKKKPKLFSV